MGNKMTDEQKKAHIAALLRERDGYERYGLTERVAEVDAELSRWGHRAQTPAKRATKMTRKAAEEL
jgi:hypothetical protein